MPTPQGPMVGLDFETFGTRDLNKVGLDNYVADPNFRPLLAGINIYDPLASRPIETVYDFVTGSLALNSFIDRLYDLRTQNAVFGAHNAAFEKQVLRWIAERKGARWLLALDVVDTAVIARCYGAHGKLELAARQMFNDHKHEAGTRLIKKFCVGEMPGMFNVMHDPDWELFKTYCAQDARLSADILSSSWNTMSRAEAMQEHQYSQITQRMNDKGWPVDVKLVKEIQNRYHINLDEALAEFRKVYDPPRMVTDKHGNEVLAEQLNVNSLKQLKEWCAERGIRTKSFSSDAVTKLLDQIQKKMDADAKSGYRLLTMQQRNNYHEVAELLKLKQILGGSSLSKLPVILNTVSDDGRLRNQYMHCGAGQTYRTTGVGVQMQNLKRLPPTPLDMESLYLEGAEVDNETLAENLRQVFTSSEPYGFLIVGDFSSVESRGLAYLAGENWKLEAYREGKDLYKVLASSMFHLSYEAITKSQRQSGKTGELGCGYGAGGKAIVDFSAKIGNPMDLEEATALVTDWRTINPKTVELWATLERLLRETLTLSNWTSVNKAEIGNGLTVTFFQIYTPVSLTDQHPGAVSICMRLSNESGVILRRIFHGCYLRGSSICFYKPSGNVNGKPWTAWYTDPKTKARKYYSLYGGKLAGILTQSFCRELFFQALSRVEKSFEGTGVDLIGQFHDEIVLDWAPPKANIDMSTAVVKLQNCMSYNPQFPQFPLAAEIKFDHRYTK